MVLSSLAALTTISWAYVLRLAHDPMALCMVNMRPWALEDLSALFASGSTIARVPLFLLAILLARGLPALVYIRTVGLSAR